LASGGYSQILAPLVRQPPPDQLGIQTVPKNALREEGAPTVLRKDKKLIEPVAEDVSKFKTLLNRSNYGIAKLLNTECSPEENNSKVINAAGACGNSLPGKGAAFSFRRGDHCLSAISDIKLKNGEFIVGSVFTQGLIASLEDVELEKIEMNVSGIKYLEDFQPAGDIGGAKKQIEELERGVIVNGQTYSRSIKIEASKIYILRSIAYRTGSDTGDKRRDIIVAFQVVRQDEDGNVTLVWKELKNKESPKINLGK